MPIVASQIDPTDAFFNGPNFARAPIWESGGSLYAGLIWSNGGKFGVWKSTDAGATWAQQDAGNAPSVGKTSVNFDGVSTLLVSDLTDTGGPNPRPLRIYEFDCLTDTWSTIAVAGPMGSDTYGVFKRPDNSYVVIYAVDFNPSNLFAVVYNGAWVNDQDIGVAAGAVVIDAMCSAAMDSTGRIHAFFTAGNYATFWYQALETTNLLGASHQFLDPLQNAGTQGQPPIGQAVVSGASIVVAVNVSALTTNLEIGTPLNAPVWTLTAPIDSGFPPTIPPGLVIDGANLVVSACSVDPPAVVRLGNCSDPAFSNPVNWTFQEVYDTSIDLTPPDFDATWGMTQVFFGAGSVLLSANYFLSVPPFSFLGFYVGSFSFGPIPPVGPAFNHRIDARTLPDYALPRRAYADNTGANRCCYPLKARC